MDWHVWFAYFLACCLIAISPGSGAVLSMGHGLAYGVRRTSATIAGLQLGLVLVSVVAGAGVGAVLIASTSGFAAVKLLGAAYLMYLGWKQWHTPVASDTLDPRMAEAGGAARPALAGSRVAAMPGTRERFLIGLMTNVTNPKSIVFLVAVLPQFMNPTQPLWPQLGILILTGMVVDTVVMHGFAFLASRAQRWLGGVQAQRMQNRVFGGILLAMGAALLMFKRVP
jgi:homoserine/homoserine lactone efflux protein